MGRHWMLITALGFLIAGIVGICLWWVYGRMMLLGTPKGQPKTRRLPFWRRPSQKDYELVERHEV